jgi:hypothetical protein
MPFSTTRRVLIVESYFRRQFFSEFFVFFLLVSFHSGTPCSCIIQGMDSRLSGCAVQRRSLTPSTWSTTYLQVKASTNLHLPIAYLVQCHWRWILLFWTKYHQLSLIAVLEFKSTVTEGEGERSCCTVYYLIILTSHNYLCDAALPLKTAILQLERATLSWVALPSILHDE